MTSVWITDAEIATSCGQGVDALWTHLISGAPGIDEVTRFGTECYITSYAACVPDLTPTPQGSLLYPLLEQVLPESLKVPDDAALITATTKAGIDSLQSWSRGRAGGMEDTLASTVLQWLQAELHLHGPATNINAACASSTIALARAANMIAHDAVDCVLVCCADLVSEFVFSGFSALQALSPEPCRPFDQDRHGLTLGEGAASLLLMSQARAEREGRSCLGQIVGWGAANDANHITAPARDGCGLVQAVERSLRVADAEPGDVSGISAHGTATVYNDLMELVAFRRVFGERRVPIHSVKGAIGHTLAAAGAIETALSLRMLDRREMPPTLGFEKPEEGAAGRVSKQAQSLESGLLLSTNSGFGGINGALLLAAGGRQ